MSGTQENSMLDRATSWFNQLSDDDKEKVFRLFFGYMMEEGMVRLWSEEDIQIYDLEHIISIPRELGLEDVPYWVHDGEPLI